MIGDEGLSDGFDDRHAAGGRGLEEDGYSALKALVADYVTQSQRRDEPAILVNLERLTDQQ